MPKEFINPASLPDWSESFSQVVVSTGGKTIYVSGQVSVDENQTLVGKGDLRAQALKAFQNLNTALAAAGALPSDVIKLNIYVCDFKPEDADIIREALKKFFTHKNLPASTWLSVHSLAGKGFLIEVDAIAVVGDS
jgi:enamine deaminase RidA (YjgF/YER057c/UK114 family)